MNAAESLRICRLAKALSPAQAVDEYTPDAWAIVLASVRYIDAEQALMELGGEQEWIHVSHIKKRVKRIRDQRSTAFGTPTDPPPEASADPEVYHRWYAETVRAVRDGDLTRENYRPTPIPAATPEQIRSLRELVASAKSMPTEKDAR